MKRFRVVFATMTVMLLLFANARAQRLNEMPNMDIIPSIPLAITCSKTTNLVFPFKIKSVDRGSKDVLVQLANGVENVLQLKAAKENFEETNLSVITSAKLYSFTVSYSPRPAALNFNFLKDSTATSALISKFTGISNEAIMETDAQYVFGQQRSVYGIRDKNNGMKIRLTGLYIRDEVLYFQIQLQNKSNIAYDVDMLNFFTRDKKQARRTASQETQLVPLFSLGNKDSIKSNTTQSLVVAFPKFTIPDKKNLYVQMMERNGGRHLHIKIGNRTIIKAKLLPETALTVLP